MWGRHRKRSARLRKQLSLGLLEDAMGRVEQRQRQRQRQQEGGPGEVQPHEAQAGEAQPKEAQAGEAQPKEAQAREAKPTEAQAKETQAKETQAREAQPYPGSVPPPAAAPDRASLLPADVQVDNSAGPPAGDPLTPRQRQRRAERTGESTRHRSLG
jgi:hypothetical protein